MRFHVPSYSMAIFLTSLSMGAVGLCILLPIACIQWTWNMVMSTYGFLPLINGWQAALLYLAAATLLLLSGIVPIELEPES